MKRFVIGDIHGGHKALLQCLQRSKFNMEKDVLISLGDICDGWPEVNKVMDELLNIKHLKLILGNHDEWTLRWMKNAWMEDIWTKQGGEATLDSYQRDRTKVPDAHRRLLENAVYYIELNNKLFVHGGIDTKLSMSDQSPQVMMWDRDLLNKAFQMSKISPEHRYGLWNDIFIGHTTTEAYQSFKPIHACNVWALDTGAGWSGKLTIMDIDSYQYWQSDFVPDLYPQIQARRAYGASH